MRTFVKLSGVLIWIAAGYLTCFLIGDLALFCMVLFPIVYLILSAEKEMREEADELKIQIKKLEEKIDALTELNQEPADPDSCPYRKLVLLAFDGKKRLDLIRALTDAGLTFEQACSCLNLVPSVVMEGITEEECRDIMELLKPYDVQMQIKPDWVSQEHNSAWTNRNSDA